MDKEKYAIHHQAVAFCPKCKEMAIEDLGEDDNADGVEITCPKCGHDYELKD